VPDGAKRLDMSVKLATSDHDAKTSARPYSIALLGDLLRILDVSLILVLGLVIYFIYVYPEFPDTASQYLVTVPVATIMMGLIFHWSGVYGGDVIFTYGLRVRLMLGSLALSFALLLLIAFALKISSSFSRVWLVTWFFASAILLTAGRFYVGHHIAQLARRGRFANRTVIVGTGAQAEKLARHLGEYDAVRTRILGFIDDESLPADKARHQSRVLGGLEDLVGMVRNDEVDQVFIALPWNEAERVRQVTHRLAMTPVTIRLAPDLAGFEFPDRSYAEVAGLPMLPLFDRPISGWSQLTKAIEDRVLATVFLLLFSAVLLFVALAVKLTSRGPVLFKQKRYGFNNQLIEIWKFRTMFDHLADHEADRLATKNDARVTPLGKLLRRTSLDELPQLFNVLRGDMSIVGPRPHAVAAKAGDQLYYDVVDQYAARHKVKPGMTGWAQIHGWRGETSTVEDIQKRVEHDLYYIDNWSIGLDFQIIARTVTVLFKGEKAY
jgi:polysaccharide biosynthesis protein PslA